MTLGKIDIQSLHKSADRDGAYCVATMHNVDWDELCRLALKGLEAERIEENKKEYSFTLPPWNEML